MGLNSQLSISTFSISIGLLVKTETFLIKLENEERQKTGLSTLKVGYNRIHGYYIEISRGQATQAPPYYTRRQTLKNAERFIVPELKTFEPLTPNCSL